jgi:hypothetical protein
VADHALVVGCDAYPNAPGADLRGAVADALAVRDWLTGPGGVPEANVACLLSPSAAGVQPPAGAATGPATLTEFAFALDAVRQAAAGPADRLFVYFAGHGMRTDPVNPVVAHDALLLRDFDRRAPQLGCVGVQDLVSRLEQTRFGAVVVVLDACRNFPFRYSITLGGLGFNGPGASVPARIFLLQATLPGRTAHGSAVGGVIRGDFTVAVLDALAGAGAAKRFDDEDPRRPYVVDWNGLTAYVEAAVPDQGPRPRGDGTLLLATFPDGAFDPVKLTVEVDPDAVRADPQLSVSVTYTDPRQADVQRLTSTGPAPVELLVPPRRHRVRAGLGERWDFRPVDVYADTTVRLTVDGDGPPTLRAYTPEVQLRSEGQPEGRVDVVADDPLAPIELRTLSGRVVRAGVGRLAVVVEPGQYTVAALDHAGREHLGAVEVLPATAVDMAMRLPTPDDVAVRHAQRHAGTDPARAVVCVVTGDGQDTTVLDAPPEWLSVAIAGHTVTVPLAPGVVVVLLAVDAPLSATFYDVAALGDDAAVRAMDRSQRLYAAGRRAAAARVLRTSDGGPGPAFRALVEALGGGSPGSALRHGLAAAVGPGERGRLLPAEPWAVFLDRPDPDR